MIRQRFKAHLVGSNPSKKLSVACVVDTYTVGKSEVSEDGAVVRYFYGPNAISNAMRYCLFRNEESQLGAALEQRFIDSHRVAH